MHDVMICESEMLSMLESCCNEFSLVEEGEIVFFGDVFVVVAHQSLPSFP